MRTLITVDQLQRIADEANERDACLGVMTVGGHLYMQTDWDLLGETPDLQEMMGKPGQRQEDADVEAERRRVDVELLVRRDYIGGPLLLVAVGLRGAGRPAASAVGVGARGA